LAADDVIARTSRAIAIRADMVQRVSPSGETERTCVQAAMPLGRQDDRLESPSRGLGGGRRSTDPSPGKEPLTMKDESLLEHIERLTKEEHMFWSQKEGLSDYQKERLDKIKIELDQCWDLLRQRRALREFGEDPDAASMRGPGIVETYQQE
jgi:hypothetical protein